MAAWLDNAANWLVGHHLAPYLFALLLFIAFAEAALFLGFVIPGETALVVGGALAGKGVFPLAFFLPAAILTAVAGDSVGYEVGRLFGPRIRSSRLGVRMGQDRWTSAEKFFERHGGKAVFMGRSIALLRALVPTVAGMSGLRYRIFLPWNVLGGTVWGGGVVLLGYVFAHSLGALERGLKFWTYGVLALLVIGLVVLHLRRRSRERKREPASVES